MNLLDSIPKAAERYSFVSVNACPVCNHNKHTPFYKDMRQELRLEFSRCQQCNALFQNPRLTMDSLQSYFNSSHFMGESGNQPADSDLGYYDYEDWERSYQKNANSILKNIRRYVAPPASLCEIGGATGWFLHHAQTAGYDVLGLDISERLAKQVKMRHDIDVQVSSIEDTSLDSDSFDIVCSLGGIACWYNPQRAVGNIRRMLKKDGVFCFNYTTHDSIAARVRGNKFFEYNHASLVIYSQNAMHRLLNESGVSILEERLQWQKASIGRILSYLKFQTLYRLAKRIGIANTIVVCPSFGTHLIIAGRK